MDDWLYDEIKRWLVLEFLNLSSESYFALFDFFIAYVKMYILVLLSFSKKIIIIINIFKATVVEGWSDPCGIFSIMKAVSHCDASFWALSVFYSILNFIMYLNTIVRCPSRNGKITLLFCIWEKKNCHRDASFLRAMAAR